MFRNEFNHKIIDCNNDSFSKILLRSYLPQKDNQFYLNQAPPNQATQSLGQNGQMAIKS